MDIVEPKLRIKIDKSKISEFINESIIEINLISKLGSGNYGKVYKINETLAIKILKNNDCSEYEICSKLKDIPHNEYCPNLIEPLVIGNIVKFTNIENENIYNEWLNANNLVEQKIILIPLLDKVDLHEYNISNIILSICNAELFLEQKLGIIHMDIKPNNLMKYNNRLILIDLGYIESSESIFNPKKTYDFIILPTIICKNSYVPSYSLALLIINLYFPIYNEKFLNSDKLILYINRCNLSQYYKRILMKMIIPSIDYKNLMKLF